MATSIFCILTLFLSNLLFAAEEPKPIVWKKVSSNHPLFQAVINVNLPSLQQQLNAGESPYIYIGFSARSLLHFAIWKKNKPIIQHLVGNKIIPIDIQDRFGDTPLHDAAEFGLLDIVKLLLAHKAPVNAQNKYDQTPLCNAYSTDITNTLLEAGADPNLGFPLLTPFVIAPETSSNLKQRLSLLLDAGADIDCVEQGRSVISVYKEDNGIFQLLLSYGPNIYLVKNAYITEQISNPNSLLGTWHQAVHQLRYSYVLLGRVLPPEVVQHIFHLVYRNTHDEDISGCNLPGKGIFKFLARTGRWGPPNKNENHQLIFATHGTFDRMIEAQRERSRNSLPFSRVQQLIKYYNSLK